MSKIGIKEDRCERLLHKYKLRVINKVHTMGQAPAPQIGSVVVAEGSGR